MCPRRALARMGETHLRASPRTQAPPSLCQTATPTLLELHRDASEICLFASVLQPLASRVGGKELAYFLAINLIAGFPCGSLAPRSRKNRYCSARLARPRPGPRDRLYVGRDLPLVTYSAQNGAVFARSRTLLSPRNAPRSPLDESGAGPRRPGGAPGSYASALSEKRKSYRTPTQIFAADRGRVFSRRVSRGRNCTSDEGGGTTRRSGRRPAL